MNRRNEAGGFRPQEASRAGSRSASSWPRAGQREPGLDELLDDPIMALLWRGDRLEPRSARATVLGLREVLRRRNRHLEPLEA